MVITSTTTYSHTSRRLPSFTERAWKPQNSRGTNLPPPVKSGIVERPRRRGRKGEGAQGGAEHGHRRISAGAGAGAVPAIAMDPTSRLSLPAPPPAPPPPQPRPQGAVLDNTARRGVGTRVRVQGQDAPGRAGIRRPRMERRRRRARRVWVRFGGGEREVLGLRDRERQEGLLQRWNPESYLCPAWLAAGCLRLCCLWVVCGAGPTARGVAGVAGCFSATATCTRLLCVCCFWCVHIGWCGR